MSYLIKIWGKKKTKNTDNLVRFMRRSNQNKLNCQKKKIVNFKSNQTIRLSVYFDLTSIWSDFEYF